MAWPRIEVGNHGRATVVDSLLVAFFLNRSHRELTGAILSGLDRYLDLVGPDRLRVYVDDEGEGAALDRATLDQLRTSFANPGDGQIADRLTLLDSDTVAPEYEFSYYGIELPPADHPAYRNHLRCRVPASLLSRAGVETVVRFATELSMLLPHSVGYVSPALSYGRIEEAVGVARRHPGFDLLNHEAVGVDLDDAIPGIYWLMYFGEDLVRKMGGIDTLRLTLPNGVTVSRLPHGQASVMIGREPDVGDTNRDSLLLPYREAARALEPYLHIPSIAYFFNEDGVPDREETDRWYRRFLE